MTPSRRGAARTHRLAGQVRSSRSVRSRQTRAPLDLQRQFFARMGLDQQLRQIFEHLKGIAFFVKDEHSRLVAANQALLDHLGVTSEEDLIGRTDDELVPPQIADAFVRDDRYVLSTGKPLINRVEIWYDEQRMFDWFVTNKLPVHDARGRVIGVMGTIQAYTERRSRYVGFSQIAPVVEHIRVHHRSRVSVQELADLAGMSVRQLDRHFQREFAMGPHEFLMKTRIQAASDALIETDASIAQIADEFGFCDQSAFTRQFRQCVGLTPAAHRKKYRH